MKLLWKTVLKLLKKLKIALLYDPKILLLGIYLEKMKEDIKKIYAFLCFFSMLYLFILVDV